MAHSLFGTSFQSAFRPLPRHFRTHRLRHCKCYIITLHLVTHTHASWNTSIQTQSMSLHSQNENKEQFAIIYNMLAPSSSCHISFASSTSTNYRSHIIILRGHHGILTSFKNCFMKVSFCLAGSARNGCYFECNIIK